MPHNQIFAEADSSCSSKVSLGEPLGQMGKSSANQNQRFNSVKNQPKEEMLNDKIYSLNGRSVSSTPPSVRVFNADLNSFVDERHRKPTQSRTDISKINLRSGEDIENKNHGGSIEDDEDDDDDDQDIDDENIDDEDIDTDLDGNSFDNGNRKKKTRTVFSRNQVFQLESTFDMKRYLSSSERSSLANSLQLTETQIKIWFQNRRNKWKRQLAAEIETNNNLANVIQHQQHPNNHQLPQGNRGPSYMMQQSNPTQLHSHHPSAPSNQRMVRVPVIYHQNESSSNNHKSTNFLNSPEIESHGLINSSSLSSSSHSSLSSPLQQGHSQSAAAVAAAAVLNNMAAAQQFGHQSAPNLINSSPANGNTLLSPSMLAAAAYYAAQFGPNASPGPLKQPVTGIL